MVPTAADPVAQGRFEPMHGLAVVKDRRQIEWLQQAIGRFVIGHRDRVGKGHEHPSILEIAVQGFVGEQIGEQFIRYPQDGLPGPNGPFQMPGVAVGGKAQQPERQGQVRSWFDVERGFTFESAHQFVTDGARRTQRGQVADEDQAAVAMGCPGAHLILFDDAYRLPGTCQVVSASQTDDTATDHQNVTVHGFVRIHGLPHLVSRFSSPAEYLPLAMCYNRTRIQMKYHFSVFMPKKINLDLIELLPVLTK